jgi:NADPH-dependent curcumin reductase CurA
MGLRTVGIARAAEKVAWTINDAGFDACVSYKSQHFSAELAAACPDGIDIDMEHVGGEVLSTILGLMAQNGRIVISGLIDQYNAAVSPPGPNWGIIVARHLTVSGLRVFNHFDLMPKYERLMRSLILDDGFTYREDVLDGLTQAPISLARVLTGTNFGKSLIRLECCPSRSMIGQARGAQLTGDPQRYPISGYNLAPRLAERVDRGAFSYDWPAGILRCSTPSSNSRMRCCRR